MIYDGPRSPAASGLPARRADMRCAACVQPHAIEVRVADGNGLPGVPEFLEEWLS